MQGLDRRTADFGWAERADRGTSTGSSPFEDLHDSLDICCKASMGVNVSWSPSSTVPGQKRCKLGRGQARCAVRETR